MLLRWGVVLAAVALRSWQGPRLGLERRDCLTFGVFTVVFGRIGMLLPGLLPPGGEAVLLGDAPLHPSLAGGIAGAAVGALLFSCYLGGIWRRMRRCISPCCRCSGGGPGRRRGGYALYRC